MNRSALALFAMSARLASGIFTSVVLVNMTFIPGYFFFIISASSFDTLMFTSFSLALFPNAPGSIPPFYDRFLEMLRKQTHFIAAAWIITAAVNCFFLFFCAIIAGADTKSTSRSNSNRI